MAEGARVVVLKTGAWDVLHEGHLNALEFAAQLGDRLVVGVATDAYITARKGRAPLMPYHERARLVSALRVVDATVPYRGTEDTLPVQLYGVTIKVVDPEYGVGDGAHAERQRSARVTLEALGVRFVYLPRTPGRSSSMIRRGG